MMKNERIKLFRKLWLKLFDKSWLNFDEKFPNIGDNVEILVIMRIAEFSKIFKSDEPFIWVIADKDQWVKLLDRDTKWRIKK